jgi:hypothetical protein
MKQMGTKSDGTTTIAYMRTGLDTTFDDDCIISHLFEEQPFNLRKTPAQKN